MGKESFASRLQHAMSLRNIKQIELCEKTQIPKSAMSQYVNGAFEPKQDRLSSLAKALSVSEAWLLGYDVPIQRDEGITIEGADMSPKFQEFSEMYGVSSETIKDIFLSPNFLNYLPHNGDIYRGFENYFVANNITKPYNKPVSEEDRLRAENNELFDKLPKEKQQQALDYLKFLVDHQDKE